MIQYLATLCIVLNQVRCEYCRLFPPPFTYDVFSQEYIQFQCRVYLWCATPSLGADANHVSSECSGVGVGAVVCVCVRVPTSARPESQFGWHRQGERTRHFQLSLPLCPESVDKDLKTLKHNTVSLNSNNDCFYRENCQISN